jgi:hypothetical protein
MEKNRLSRLIEPLLVALCPMADRLDAKASSAIAREVAATLALQPWVIRAGLVAYLQLVEWATLPQYGKGLSRMRPAARADVVARLRFPLWSLVRKLLTTLISLNAFDHLSWQKESVEIPHERKMA